MFLCLQLTVWHCKSVSETSENDSITTNGHAESHEVPTASVFDLADNFRNGISNEYSRTHDVNCNNTISRIEDLFLARQKSSDL